MWDIEDILYKIDKNHVDYKMWEYIIEMLRFIDKWLFYPQQYSDYFNKLIGKSYIEINYSLRNPVRNYFYDLRIRIQHFFKEINLDSLIFVYKNLGVNKLDCIFEIQSYVIHSLNSIDLFTNRKRNYLEKYIIKHPFQI